MPDPVNLTGEIAAAIDGAALRGHTLAVAYVRDDGSPSVSFRGSTYVHGPTQLAIWARKRDSGLVAAVVDRPRVSLVFFEMEGPGARYLAIEGRARVVPELDREVYDAIIEPERIPSVRASRWSSTLTASRARVRTAFSSRPTADATGRAPRPGAGVS
jgi:hypothetical protein